MKTIKDKLDKNLSGSLINKTYKQIDESLWKRISEVWIYKFPYFKDLEGLSLKKKIKPE